MNFSRNTFQVSVCVHLTTLFSAVVFNYCFMVIIFIRYDAPQYFFPTSCVSEYSRCCCEGDVTNLKMSKSLNIVIKCFNEFVCWPPNRDSMWLLEGLIMIRIEDVLLWQWRVKEAGNIKLNPRILKETTSVQENLSVPLRCVVTCLANKN